MISHKNHKHPIQAYAKSELSQGHYFVSGRACPIGAALAQIQEVLLLSKISFVVQGTKGAIMISHKNR
jgi:hypothetical protein